MGLFLRVSVLAFLLAQPFSEAFLLPSKSVSNSVTTQRVNSNSNNAFLHARPSVELNAFPTTSVSASLPSVNIDTSSLTQYFLETLISYGVPAFLWIVVIAFAAKSFKGAKQASNESGPNGNLFGGRTNVVNELYNDLYGSSQDDTRNKSPFAMLSGRNPPTKTAKNLGVPKEQYLKITKLNDIYSSYKYSLTAATESKAKAAAQYRSTAFDSALQRAFDSSVIQLNNAQKVDLLLEEKEFLNRGNEILDNITVMQTELTKQVIMNSMKDMNVEIGEVDVFDDSKKENVIDATIVETADGKDGEKTEKVEKTEEKKKKGSSTSKKNLNRLVKDIEKQNTELLRLELDFIRAVIEVMGPDRANGIREALIGNVASGGAGVAGGLLKSLQDRPLSLILDTMGYSNTENEKSHTKNLFVTDFPGDVNASQVETLREEVTAIITAAKPGDEALLVLQTGGGTVTGYGLAAAQLQRFKKHGMKLTICVEQVAASGGYMMTCVADRVIASPFAVLGSIGVISDLPNVYERLKKEGIEFQTVTAGKYKRTLTPTKKVTPEDLNKQKEELEGILTLFKGFVKQNRPSLDIDLVATGETWFGEDALEKGLCDELNTVDDVLVDFVGEGYNVYNVRYDPITPAPALGGLLPLGSSDANEGGMVRGTVRWLVRNILPTIKDELTKELKTGMSTTTTSSTSQLQERYMFKDPSNVSNSIKAQD